MSMPLAGKAGAAASQVSSAPLAATQVRVFVHLHLKSALAYARYRCWKMAQLTGIPVDRLDDEVIAAEAVQILLQNRDSVRDDDSYLKGTIRRLVRRDTRRHWFYLTTASLGDVSDDDTGWTVEQEDQDENPIHAENSAARAVLKDLINELSPALRQVADAFFLKRLPRDKISEVLGLKDDAFRQRFSRARRELKIKIEVLEKAKATVGVRRSTRKGSKRKPPTG
jgi:RNA polymerase sigma factor (sigma-70 family)